MSNGMEGPARRRTSNPGDRREQALLRALEQLLAQARLDEISIDKVAREAGVSRTAFYFYFKSKEAALEHLAQESLADVWDGVNEWLEGDGLPRETLLTALMTAIREWDDHRAVLVGVIDASAYNSRIADFWRASVQRFIDGIAARIERDIESGIVDSEVDANGTAEAICWMTERLCYMHLGHARQSTPDEIAEQVYAVFSRAIYGS